MKKILLAIFIVIAYNSAAQNTDNISFEQTNTKNRLVVNNSLQSIEDYEKYTIYVLDGNVITTEEYRAISLSKIKSVKSIRDEDDPVFKMFAKKDTKCVRVVSLANNFEESLLNVQLELASLPVILVDGVEVADFELVHKVDVSDIDNMEIIKDKNVCEVTRKLFAPREGGVVIITTKSKKLLNELLQAHKEHIMNAREKDHKNGTIRIR